MKVNSSNPLPEVTGQVLVFARSKRLTNEPLAQRLADRLPAAESGFLASSLTRDFAESVRTAVEKSMPESTGTWPDLPLCRCRRAVRQFLT